jgi:Coenzyme PQQ synthesis protein D (PqqD)
MLNLTTGRYHGLNPTAARMLETLERSESVAGALAELTREYEAPAAEIEKDLRELCAGLLERELIELEQPPAS